MPIDDLVSRAALSGTGRLLDLACGPGRMTFALSEHRHDRAGSRGSVRWSVGSVAGYYDQPAVDLAFSQFAIGVDGFVERDGSHLGVE